MTKAEKTSHQRGQIVRSYLASGLSLQAYCEQHNSYLAAGLGASHKSISAPTLSRWVACYKDGGISALRPHYPPKQGSGATLSAQQKTLLQTYWLHPNRPGVAAVCRWIEQQQGMNISYHIARRYLESLPASLKIMRREGPNAYKAKVDPAISKDYRRLKVMQQICADHHTLDLMVVEKLGDKPFRPYLTAYVDLRSRKLLSWAIKQRQPDQWVVMEVLEQLIVAYGIPQSILIDNGKDFVAKNLTGQKLRACEFGQEVELEVKGIFAELGCEVVRTTPYHGQAKWIERLFGFICEDFSKQFDTYTGSNTVTRPEAAKLYHRAIGKQAKRNVMLTLGELRRSFDTWAAWYNSQWRQNGSGMDGRSAEQVFTEEGYQRMDMPAELRQRIFCRTEKRMLRRTGVQLNNSHYYNPEIVAEYLGSELIVKRPFNDSSKVFLYSLSGEYLGEALSYEGVGLAETGHTEQDLAAKKRLAKQVRKTAKAYEEALAEQMPMPSRPTIADQHRAPMHEKLGLQRVGKAAGAEHLSEYPSKDPSKDLARQARQATGKAKLNILKTLTGDDYDETE